MSPALRLALVLVAAGLAGCAKAPDPKVTAALGIQPTTMVDATSTVPSPRPAPVVGPSALLASGGSSSGGPTEDYRIAPLDVLDITVFQVPDLGGTFPVSLNGKIDMPLIGSVAVGGKTLDELKADLTKQLGDTYLQSPKVTVAMKDAVSQRVTVEGAINKPGVYPTSGPTTLMQVVALAGGLDRAVADESGIVVFRKVAGKRQAAKFDYKAISAGTAEDPVIAGGDIVVVDESGTKSAFKNLRDSLGMFGLFAPILGII